MKNNLYFDVLIIGSGAAGLTTALNLPSNLKIGVIAKNDFNIGSTYFAQGGIAAVLDENDSVSSHVKDTQIAGANLCNLAAVRFTSSNSKAAIDWLIAQGVPFTHKDGKPHLTREGGHSQRRIIHCADATGKAVFDTLINQTKKSSNIKLLAHYAALDLITKHNKCAGLYALNVAQNKIETIAAQFCVLATGGASKAYLYTTNPDGSSGDGIAMAWRAGCRVANMEFNQFHPTCLYHPQAKSFLVTEALRGEGAELKLADGTLFMRNFDERAELAPRDIVARAIDHEMKRLGVDCVYLDISHKDADFIKSHFPTVYAQCLKFGIDITKQPIPVVPAAHYTCGGVVVNLSAQTDISNLYAVGETSFTGLHGANRMASNSLLECIVFGQAAALDIAAKFQPYFAPQDLPDWDASKVTNSDENIIISHNWDELRRFMWDYVGIVRTDKRLQRAQNRVQLLLKEIQDFYSNYQISRDLIELRNLAQVAELIIRSAQMRRESRGLHFSLDYPQMLPTALDTVLTPNF